MKLPFKEKLTYKEDFQLKEEKETLLQNDRQIFVAKFLSIFVVFRKRKQ